MSDNRLTVQELRDGALAQGDFDPIPEGELGSSRAFPYTVAPPDWKENGVPYGAWFQCVTCKQVSRSTFMFDCRAKQPGEKLMGDCCYCGIH